MLFATLIGSLSFSGSIIAFLKLEGKFEKPHTFPGQNILERPDPAGDSRPVRLS